MTSDTAAGGDDRDDELLAELRRVVSRIDPVPPDVTAFAKAALGWRRIDADLAELLADSALDANAALTRSGAGHARALTFRSADLAIDVEIGALSGPATMLGQLAPATAATVEVQAADGAIAGSAEVDELGRFRLQLPAGGRIRLRVVRDDGGAAPVETSWLAI